MRWGARAARAEAPGWRIAAAAVWLLLAGCGAHVQSYSRSRLQTDAGEFFFEYSEVDRTAKAQVEVAVRKASVAIARWGGLAEPVTVHILPSHAALEQAVDRHGYPWLRAWARYDEVLIQSPRTWTFFRPLQREVDELILHELTHIVMYQQAADRTHWRRKGIPGWFREGMASFTAEQGFRWPALEDLARFYERHPRADPVGDPDLLYQREDRIAYGAAHHAFTFLMRRYGAERVRSVLSGMKEGRTFEEAFQHVLGLSEDRFVKDFKRYVRLRGFRGGGTRPRAASLSRREHQRLARLCFRLPFFADLFARDFSIDAIRFSNDWA
jgi:hypothetical protein